MCGTHLDVWCRKGTPTASNPTSHIFAVSCLSTSTLAAGSYKFAEPSHYQRNLHSWLPCHLSLSLLCGRDPAMSRWRRDYLEAGNLDQGGRKVLSRLSLWTLGREARLEGTPGANLNRKCPPGHGAYLFIIIYYLLMCSFIMF